MNLCLWVFTVCKVRNLTDFIHSHRDGAKGKERYGESVRSIQQQIYQRKWVCSKMTQLCLSRSWVAVRFFCNCTLCALLMIGSPIPLSFSFCRFSFIHPKNVYGRITSFSFWPSPIPCSMLFTQFLFFLSLSPFHTYTNEHIQKKTMMLMVMIHSNAYDHIVQISVRAKQMKLNQANTNTHTTPTTTYIHTNAHCAHYKSDTVDSNNKSQRWVERKKSNTTKSNGKEKTQTPCCLERCRIFFSLWTFERNHTFSLVSSIVTLARLNHNTHNFESPLQRTFFFIKNSVCSRHDFVSLNIRIETTTQKGCVLLSKYFCFAFFLSALIVQVTYYFVPA